MKLTVFSDELMLDIRAAAKTIAGWGSRYIDLRGLINGKGIEFQSDEELKELRQYLDSLGLKVAAIQSSLLKVHLPDEERLQKEHEKLDGIIRAANALDCTLVRSFNCWQPERDRYDTLTEQPVDLQKVIDMFRPFALKAKENGITLSLECCGQSPEEVIAVIEGTGLDNVTLAWDVTNLYEFEKGVEHEERFERLFKYSSMLHVKSRGILPEVMDLPTPWHKVLKKMYDMGLDIPVSIETHYPGGGQVNKEDATRRCFMAIRDIWDEISGEKLFERAYANDPVGFVVVGLGMGAGRARQLMNTSGTKLLGVCDIDLEKAKQIGNELKVKYSSDINEFLSDPNVEVMYVVTPTGAHCDVADLCLKAGKHVLLTKPMDVDAQRCKNTIELAQELGLKLSIDYDVRQEETFLELKKAMEEGWFGKVFNMSTSLRINRPQSYFDENGGWRGTWRWDGGGSLSNQGIHEIDRIVALLGVPEYVSGHFSIQTHDIETEDIGNGYFAFKDGCTATFASTTSYPIPNAWYLRVEIFGTQGAFVMTSGGPEGKLCKWFKDGQWNDVAPYPMQRIFKQGSDRFAYYVRTGDPCGVTGIDGYNPRATLDALYKSAKLSGAMVKVD